MKTLTRRFAILNRMEFFMLAAMVSLAIIGILFIFSASSRNEDLAINALTQRQILWFLTGLMIAGGIILADYRKIADSAWLIYVGCLVLLVLVLLMGKKVYGAYRWLNLFGIQIQPSEFAKLGTMLALAHFLSDPERDLMAPKTFLLTLGLIAIPFLLIMKEPDLGTALMLLPLAYFMMFAAGVNHVYLLVLALAGLAGAAFIVLDVLGYLSWLPIPDILSDYQKQRILVFIDPGRDPLDSGWNSLQSMIAVGAGGLWGKGYLMGTQNVLGFLPRTVAPTDFIFSVIAEETGFAGSVVIVSLFAVLLWAIVRAALRARDKLGRLLCVGVATLLFCHLSVNIGMTIGLLPVTGVPLPLISYGGSFMVCTMAGLGLAQSVYVRRIRR